MRRPSAPTQRGAAGPGDACGTAPEAARRTAAAVALLGVCQLGVVRADGGATRSRAGSSPVESFEQPPSSARSVGSEALQPAALGEVELRDGLQLAALEAHVGVVQQRRTSRARARRTRAPPAPPRARTAARRRRSARPPRPRASSGRPPAATVAAELLAHACEPGPQDRRRAPGTGWRSRPRRGTRAASAYPALPPASSPVEGSAAALPGSGARGPPPPRPSGGARGALIGDGAGARSARTARPRGEDARRRTRRPAR